MEIVIVYLVTAVVIGPVLKRDVVLAVAVHQNIFPNQINDDGITEEVLWMQIHVVRVQVMEIVIVYLVTAVVIGPVLKRDVVLAVAVHQNIFPSQINDDGITEEVQASRFCGCKYMSSMYK
ncbi:unnamed protein product [Lupinus luteus]|uniref:Uncharacterized protein n=1 Tax=Lupinus luteus TaxID=3873 RepID=A0AAV1YM15_LUPLU